MKQYKSAIYSLTAEQKVVFEELSDPLKIAQHLGKLGTMNGVEIAPTHSNEFSIALPMVGKMEFRLEQKAPYNLVSYQSINTPLDVKLTFHIQSSSGDSTMMQLELTENVPPMIQIMFGSKIKEMLHQMATQLSHSFTSPIAI